MKNICFIGAFDKLDLILYIARIISDFGKKVLIVDATKLEKSRYIVPTINPTKSYITRYADIDIAIGFKSYNAIENYLGDTENYLMKYDYAIINADDGDTFDNFNNTDTIKNYFVTSYDMYSIKRGFETISQIKKPIEITKVIFSTKMDMNDDYYIDYLSLGYKVIWSEKKINFPYETQDIEAMAENQKFNRIKLKGLSQQYKDNLEYIITDIIPDINLNNLRKVMKNMEREE